MCHDPSDPELFLHWLSFTILEANGSHSFLLKKKKNKNITHPLFFKSTVLPQELKLIYREIQEMKLSTTAFTYSLIESSFLSMEDQSSDCSLEVQIGKHFKNKHKLTTWCMILPLHVFLFSKICTLNMHYFLNCKSAFLWNEVVFQLL